MSRHYIAQQQSCFMGQAAGLDELIRQLGRTRPELLQRLATMDLPSDIAGIAREALDEVAQAHGIRVVKEFERPYDFHTGAWQPPAGECVGVLRFSENRQIGLIRNGTALTAHAVFPQDSGEGDLAEIRRELERAYRKRAVSLTLAILSGSAPEQQTLADGTVVLTAAIVGGRQ